MRKKQGMQIGLGVLLGAMILVCTSVMADATATPSTTSLSSGEILSYIQAEQAFVGTSFDASYQRIYDIFQRTGLDFLKSLDYQSLVCLGVLSGQSVLDQLQTDKMNLKISFSNDFVTLENRLASLEDRHRVQIENNIGFVDEAAFQASEQQIKADVDHIVSVHTGIILNFESSYKLKILGFIKDMGQYIVQNKDLLQMINAKVVKINYLVNQAAQLQSGVTQLYTNLGIADLIDRISNLQTATQNVFASTITPFIDTQVKKYKILAGLSGALTDLKSSTLAQYTQDKVTLLSSILSPRFDYEAYQDLQQRLQLFKDKYYPKGAIQCSLVLIPTTTQDTLQTSLFNDLPSMVAMINSGVAKSQNAGAQVKDQLLSGVQLLRGTGATQKITAFQKAVAGVISSLTQQATQGNTPTVATTGTVNPTPPKVTTGIVGLPKGFTFTKPYTLNQHQTAIGYLQQFLTMQKYYTGAINAIYTQATKDAVYTFQRAYGLVKSTDKKDLQGYFGPATRAKVNALLK